MNTTNLLVAFLAVAALATSIIAISRQLETPIQAGEEKQQAYGGTNPDIPSSYLMWGGVREWRYSSALRAGTTTVCSFPAPVATSSLRFAGVVVTTGSTTAFIGEVGKATTAFATTTSLGTFTVGANGNANFVASSTIVGTVLTNGIVSPGSFINILVGGGTGGHSLDALDGHCEVSFIEL